MSTLGPVSFGGEGSGVDVKEAARVANSDVARRFTALPPHRRPRLNYNPADCVRGLKRRDAIFPGRRKGAG